MSDGKLRQLSPLLNILKSGVVSLFPSMNSKQAPPYHSFPCSVYFGGKKKSLKMSLKLLQNYGSDSDCSEEEEGEKGGRKEEDVLIIREKEGINKKKLPPLRLPLPSEIENLFPSPSEEEDGQERGNKDNPEEHGGRQRSFPHMRGNWVSFVHISLNGCESVAHQVQLLKDTVMDFPDVQLHHCDDLHLSLSRTVVFRHHWIDSFVQSLKEGLANVTEFSVVFDQFQVYLNDEGTRTFVAMDIHPSSQLFELVKACDSTLAEYQLDPYYEDPCFHVSLCWILGDHKNFITKSVLPVLNSKWYDFCEGNPEFRIHDVGAISFKTGNQTYNFNLQK